MNEAETLLFRAYERARLSGKPNWNRMTTAVLKNRLLDLTEGTFDEARFGASNFSEFVRLNHGMLSLDRSVFPPLVTLIGTKSVTQPHDVAVVEPSYRIRPDLWKAALDYSSGIRYVWDAAANQAVPAEGRDGGRTITPATKSVQRAWREDFRSTIEGKFSVEEESQISSWIDEHLAASHLPDRFIGKWNECFRNRIRLHLLNWFSEVRLDPPDDLSTPYKGSPLGISPETEGLREFVLSVVREMNHEELAGLMLPPAAVFRLKSTLS